MEESGGVILVATVELGLALMFLDAAVWNGGQNALSPWSAWTR
jgi:hypothetical protein